MFDSTHPAYYNYQNPYFTVGNNPVYNTTPVTAPGLDAIPQFLGPLLVRFGDGYTLHPYVSPNQSTADAAIANKRVQPQLNEMAAQVYGQLFSQIMSTLGNTELITRISDVTGYDAVKIKEHLSNWGKEGGQSIPGQFLAPIADQLASTLGLSGGSLIESMQLAYAGRMGLLSRDQYMDPFNAGKQHQAMGAASAMFTMLNGLMSKTDPATGQPLITSDPKFTQGYDRQLIMRAAMMAAGRGMFDAKAKGGLPGADVKTTKGNFAEQLSSAANGIDLEELTYTDFLGGDDKTKLTERSAYRVREMTRMVSDRMKGVVQTMRALTDLTNSIDGVVEDLEDLTNGSWLRSAGGAYDARNALLQLNAVSKIYNIDPKQAVSMVRQNRAVMQHAAGFDQSMTQLGFNGGGMFGLPAQVNFLGHVEDMITKRGLRGDPMAEARVRYQAVNAMSKNINSVAGRATQLLAFARQTGTLSREEAEILATQLKSGDRGTMDHAINRLLVTTFGSEKKGREMINDTMYMTNLRMILDDQNGRWAMDTIERGAVTEMFKQEKWVAEKQRFEYSRQALSEAGRAMAMSTEGADRVATAISKDLLNLKDEDGNLLLDKNGKPAAQAEAEMFVAHYKKRLSENMAPQAALDGTMAEFSRNPATARFAKMMRSSYMREAAAVNEAEFERAGTSEGMQAKAMVREMSAARLVTGKEAAEIDKLVREGSGTEALARVDEMVAKLSPAEQRVYRFVQHEAKSQYDRQLSVIRDNAEAESLLGEAVKSGYGAGAAQAAMDDVVGAANRYIAEMKALPAVKLSQAKKKNGQDLTAEEQAVMEAAGSAYNNFWERVSKSDFVNIFGNRNLQTFLTKVSQATMTPLSPEEPEYQEREARIKEGMDYIRGMGRAGFRMAELAPKVLGDNGWDSHYRRFFNEGVYAGSSAAGAHQYQKTVNAMAEVLRDDMAVSAEDRSTVAQDIVEFLTGDRDLRGLLKVYKKGSRAESELNTLLDAQDTYSVDKTAYRESLKDYNEQMNRLLESNKFNDLHGYIADAMSAPRITEGEFEYAVEQLTDPAVEELLGKEGVGKIFKAMHNKLAVQQSQEYLQSETDSVIKKSSTDAELKEDLKALRKIKNDEQSVVKAKKTAADRYKEKRDKHNQRAYKTMDELLITDQDIKVQEGIEASAGDDTVTKYTTTRKGPMGDAIQAMLDFVSEKEVAKKAGVASTSSLTPREYAEFALSVVKDSVSSKDTKRAEAAQGVIDKFRAASDANSKLRIAGDITLKQGNEAVPGVLEGTVTGGLSQ